MGGVYYDYSSVTFTLTSDVYSNKVTSQTFLKGNDDRVELADNLHILIKKTILLKQTFK